MRKPEIFQYFLGVEKETRGMKWVNHFFGVLLNSVNIRDIFGALRDLVPFVQFKKRVKHPWRSVNFSKVAG